MPQTLSPGFKKLLREAAYCQLATLMPDGSPQNTQVWVDTDASTSWLTPPRVDRRSTTSAAIRAWHSTLWTPQTPGASPASGAESWMLRPRAQIGSSTNWQRST